MKSIAILIPIILILQGCATIEKVKGSLLGESEASEVEERVIETTFSDVTVTETCVSTTRESIGPHGAKGWFTKLSGYGRINEPRGELDCESQPFQRTMTKKYGYGPSPKEN